MRAADGEVHHAKALHRPRTQQQLLLPRLLQQHPHKGEDMSIVRTELPARREGHGRERRDGGALRVVCGVVEEAGELLE